MPESRAPEGGKPQTGQSRTRRTVLITGGSSGIGAAMVAAFAGAGERVCFTYFQGRDRAEALGARHAALALPLALGDRQSHRDAIARLPGPVDVLILNAGIGSKTVEQMTADPHAQDEAFLSVNVVGALWLVRDLLPDMEARGSGKVILVSSVGGGITQFPGFHIADGVSKAALAYLGRHLQARYARSVIDVFTLCPGATETPMFTASTLAGLDAEQRTALLARLPGGRLIQPREVADLAVALCRDEFRLLRGAVLDASFGLGVHPGLLTGEER